MNPQQEQSMMASESGSYEVGGVRLARPFKAVRLGHFGLWHPDVKKVLSTYVDDLGFRHTDNVCDAKGNILVGFTSCNT
ncbi:MAG: hypothetical protein FGM55_12650, partial [Rhodoferax sp.]|nr:hypothetical protein [Rhodoferax sp.]